MLRQPPANESDRLEDREQQEHYENLGQIAGWACGTFALGGAVILLLSAAVLPWPSLALSLMVRYGSLLLSPGMLWGGLLFIFSSTDKNSLAGFGKRAVATSLMFVGAALLLGSYLAADWCFNRPDPEAGQNLAACSLALIACLMPGLCLASGLATAVAYDFLTEPEPSIPEAKKQAPAAGVPLWGYLRRRYRGQGMDEVYLD